MAPKTMHFNLLFYHAMITKGCYAVGYYNCVVQD